MTMPNVDAFMDSWWPIIIAVVIGVVYAIRQYFRGERCVTLTRMDGKTAIITGGSSGIGYHVAVELAKRGARVILAVKDATKGEDIASQIRQQTTNVHINAFECDVSSMASVRQFADIVNKKEDHVHLLINNAGIMMSPQSETGDKFELHMATNYIGHFLLSHLLLDKLKASSPSRIINLSAPAYSIGLINFDDIHGRTEYNSGVQFSQSKLAIMLFTLEMSRRLEGSGVTVNAVNPGITSTNIHRFMGFRRIAFVNISVTPIVWFLMKSAVDGAQTVIHCATAESLKGKTGKFYKECQECEIEENVKMDEELQQKLYSETLKWTKLVKEE